MEPVAAFRNSTIMLKDSKLHSLFTSSAALLRHPFLKVEEASRPPKGLLAHADPPSDKRGDPSVRFGAGQQQLSSSSTPQSGPNPVSRSGTNFDPRPDRHDDKELINAPWQNSHDNDDHIVCPPFASIIIPSYNIYPRVQLPTL